MRVLGQAVLETPDGVRHPAVSSGIHEATPYQASKLQIPHTEKSCQHPIDAITAFASVQSLRYYFFVVVVFDNFGALKVIFVAALDFMLKRRG